MRKDREVIGVRKDKAFASVHFFLRIFNFNSFLVHERLLMRRKSKKYSNQRPRKTSGESARMVYLVPRKEKNKGKQKLITKKLES